MTYGERAHDWIAGEAGAEVANAFHPHLDVLVGGRADVECSRSEWEEAAALLSANEIRPALLAEAHRLHKAHTGRVDGDALVMRAFLKRRVGEERREDLERALSVTAVIPRGHGPTLRETAVRLVILQQAIRFEDEEERLVRWGVDDATPHRPPIVKTPAHD